MGKVVFLEAPNISRQALKKFIGLSFASKHSAIAALNEAYSTPLVVTGAKEKLICDKSGQICYLIINWKITEKETGAHVLTMEQSQDINLLLNIARSYMCL